MTYALPTSTRGSFSFSDSGVKTVVLPSSRLRRRKEKGLLFFLSLTIILSILVVVVVVGAVLGFVVARYSVESSSSSLNNTNDDEYFTDPHTMSTAEYVWYFDDIATAFGTVGKRNQDRICLRIEDGIAFIQSKILEIHRNTHGVNDDDDDDDDDEPTTAVPVRRSILNGRRMLSVENNLPGHASGDIKLTVYKHDGGSGSSSSALWHPRASVTIPVYRIHRIMDLYPQIRDRIVIYENEDNDQPAAPSTTTKDYGRGDEMDYNEIGGGGGGSLSVTPFHKTSGAEGYDDDDGDAFAVDEETMT